MYGKVLGNSQKSQIQRAISDVETASSEERHD